VRDRLDEFGEADVVLVTFTDHNNVPAYRERHQLDLPVVVDTDRAAYRAFGLGRGSVRRVWGAKAGRRYLEIVGADGFAGLARPVEDTLQLGGDFVIDPEGKLVYGFWGEGPDDRPSVEELLAAVAANDSR